MSLFNEKQRARRLESENPEVAKASAEYDRVAHEALKGADGRVTFETIKAFMDREKKR